MSSLRERIDQEVYEAYQAGIDHNQVPFKYPAMGKSEIQEATERIIAVFEAVLLSDEVVEAAAEVVHRTNWQGAYTPLEWGEEIDDIRSAIMLDTRAALQAARMAAIRAAVRRATEGSE